MTSPANITWLTSSVSESEKSLVLSMVEGGKGKSMLPFELLGWLPCIADTAFQWLFTQTLNNVHVESYADFSQVSMITHPGAMLIGTYDRFTYGDPAGFLSNINSHMQTSHENRLIFLEGTGHTYQRKEQELADIILDLMNDWTKKQPLLHQERLIS